eukprot:CAMPEP_0117678882 /NCGR_PEP_ID=MMETSP0804-20121206/17530_1 /TAXON_ID=1074897 /ORGANISM="Tetraselmis astigmatica, Strain CCMP880" /LENGTH=775 /DNA_ID=CAMNT_0005488291 /DNA_START=56 /DNA_END=2383 /DNA_ORIENTATION=-
MSVVISGAIVLWLLASSLVLGLADDQVSSEVLDYASHRKGEFLSAQYQRALEMEASALKLAAERKFQEAEELLSLCVRIHEQLLGPRHPQLIKALLANAENSAMWGDSIGMEGKQHVEHAKELVDRALLILSSTPLPTRDTMGEEELHLLDMKQVIEQMLAAMSPPEVLTSIRGTQQLPTLPGVKVLSPGELTFGSLNRGSRWAYYTVPVAESWVHAHTKVGLDNQVMIYGIQTITTATLVTQASHISFHASIARESDAGLLEMNASGTSRPLCKWWNDTSCLRSMPVDSFTMSGGKGIGVGRSHGTLEGGAPMWLQFTELPADLGAVALLGAHLATAAADDHSFMLKVNEDPMVPMHLGEGFQTWELNPFGSSVHYFPWTRQEQLVRLKVSDLSCHVPCDTRLLFNWGSLPTSEWAHVKRAMACVHTHGSTSRLHQGGCWEQGASEGGMLFVVVFNPCPEPTTFTLEAEWTNSGSTTDGRGASEGVSIISGASTRQSHESRIEGQFVRDVPSELQGHLAHGMWRDAGKIALLLSGAIALLGWVMYCSVGTGKQLKIRPSSQRRPPRRPGNAASWWRLPSLADLSGARPSASQQDDAVTSEIMIRRGRVAVRTVRHNPSPLPNTGRGSSHSPMQNDAAASPGTRRRNVPSSMDTRAAETQESRESPLSALTTSALGDEEDEPWMMLDDSKLPEMFSCPITQQTMRDPVVAADGYTYERCAIDEWIRRKGKSPMTNLPLESTGLIPNLVLRSAILEATGTQSPKPSNTGHRSPATH